MNPAIMASTTAATTGAGAAAAARQNMIVEEEEILTTHEDAQESNREMQYKIMRGNYSTPEKLEEMLREQSYYGWSLLEVFDAQRVRLKRPASEAEKDRDRDGNPFETHKPVRLGCAANTMVLLAVGSAFVACSLLLAVYAI
jgi:hypothetical protein